MAKLSPEQQRKARLKHRYGISVEEWETMLIAQSGRCWLCEEPMKSPHVDHSHETGGVRGLLCAPCNRSLGQVEKVGLDRLYFYLQHPSNLDDA